MKTLKGLLVNVWSKPRVIEFKSTLEDIERLVGGESEGVCLESDVILYLNGIGKLKGLPSTRRLRSGDPIAGNFLIIGLDGAGNDKSLTEEQINKYFEEYKKIELNRYTLAPSMTGPMCFC